jgi:hypothetical protein
MSEKQKLILSIEAFQLSWRLTGMLHFQQHPSEKLIRVDKKALARLNRRNELLKPAAPDAAQEGEGWEE